MSDRFAGGPRGGLNFSYQARPGWILYSIRKDRNGRILEAKWRPPEHGKPEDPPSQHSRGALSVERQDRLL